MFCFVRMRIDNVPVVMQGRCAPRVKFAVADVKSEVGTIAKTRRTVIGFEQSERFTARKLGTGKRSLLSRQRWQFNEFNFKSRDVYCARAWPCVLNNDVVVRANVDL